MPQTFNSNQTMTKTTQGARLQADAQACNEAGCAQHCECQPSDPWIYAVAGTALGGLVFGSVLYYVGKNKRRTRR